MSRVYIVVNIGHDLLLYHQVDDMLIAGATRDVLHSFAEESVNIHMLKLVMVYLHIIMDLTSHKLVKE
jgi:hypothetical protein